MIVKVYKEDGNVVEFCDARHVKIEFVKRWPFMIKIKKAWHIHGYKKEKEK